MVWKPHVTVAAVIEKDQRFLMVEEYTDQGRTFNQPAGHLETGETLLAAIQREVNEETAWQFRPTALVAVQLWRRTPDQPSFLRFCFTGEVYDYAPDQALDPDITATHWLSLADIKARSDQLRSPLVLKTLAAYLRGDRQPLSILQSFLDLHE
ncbi:NUDIX hydrolase [Methylomonas paludis]|uniref:Phosphatase NudJ n=1 Tax=Methylomonas paludis TaxID=1173101 RepID=A0A975R838_9GAMM|nr:NUDIX hydrolase [Methylomonas paludis]QWF69512.1 NUDIX hydrolase [Methylomonas paludis]